MATTSADFVTRLRASGVVPVEQLDEFFASPNAPSSEATPKELLTALIAAGLVTKFQAGLLRAGKYKGFRLGSYVILDKLGAGGMGQVFRARHSTLPKEVAIKVLPPTFKTDPIALARFVREARTCAAISHPNIVAVYDVLPDSDPPHILMEYVPGVSLLGAVTGHGVFGPCEAADVGVQACTGLQKACEVGLVHRDIKPPNLLLTKTGQVKILDFGIARIKSDEDAGLTMAGNQKAILGTADYLAPEQAVDSSTVDSRADIYAMGATLYYLLAGHPPFQEKSTTAKLIRKQVTDPPPIHTLRPDVPPELSAVIQHMMARDPANRPPTPADAAALLAPFARTSPDYPGRFFGAEKSSSTQITLQDATVDQTPASKKSSNFGSGNFTIPPFDPTGSHTGTMSFIIPPPSGVFVPSGPGSSFFAPPASGFDSLEPDELDQLGDDNGPAAPSGDAPHTAPEKDRAVWKLVAGAIVVAVLAIGGLTAALTGAFSGPAASTEKVETPPATYTVIGKLVPRQRSTPVEVDGFIRDWLLLGPLPLPNDAREVAGLNRELVKGEPTLSPKAGEKVRYGDKDLTWRTCSLATWDMKMKHEFPGNTDNCAAYAVAYVFSPTDQNNLKLKYGSDDQARIWLNGKMVAEHLGGRGAKIDESVATGVSLHKGTNTLVFKLVNGGGDWGGGLRFTDAQDQPVTNLNVSVIP